MVKKGYKQTEVGIIPNTWQVISLQNLCVQNGIVRGPFGGVLKKEIFVAEGYKVYEQGNAIYKTVTRGSYYIDAAKYNKMLRFSVREGDFIVSCSGTIGMIFQIPINAPKGIINQALLKLTINDAVVNPQYFYLYFSCDSFTRRIVDDTQGGAMKNLVGMDVFRNTPFPIPPMPEQKNISIVLADITDLITNLEAIIAKKKAIKQGTMQELLTGKRRLPGYYNKWRTDIIPDVLQKQEGIKIGPFGSQLKKEYLLEGGLYKVYGQENVYTQDFSIGNRYLNREKFRQLQSCEVRSGDFLISTMGTIGKCAIVPNGICSGIMDSHLIRLRINEQKLMPEYLLHLFSEELGYLKGQTSKLSVGGIMDGLSTKIVNALNVFYPEDLSEQKAIAEFLSSMNTEIQTLEQQLTKYRQFKQGMMQQLLTGKIRLV